MEREVAVMATRLESSLGLKRKKPHIRGFADDFRHVELYGGFVEIIGDHRMEKTKDGKGSGDGGIIELPKTKGGDAESGSKEEGSGSKQYAKLAEAGSKEEDAKPAGARKRRTKTVKYRIDWSSKPLFEMEPIQFDLSRDEAFAAAFWNYHEMERSIIRQFEMKGYAEYEREEEVTDDEEDPNPVLSVS